MVLGKLLSVNLTVPRTLHIAGREIPTGIFKEPASVRVFAATGGLSGDLQADRTVHGGPEKAVYLYPLEHYPYWKAELDRNDLDAGFFGENFTTSGITEENVSIGDAFRVGSATLQVTSPRSPCFKLGARVGSPLFLRQFLESGRLGFYLRVLDEGDVGAGDTIDRVFVDPRGVSVAQMIRVLYDQRDDVESIENALGIRSLDPALRGHLQDRLAIAGGAFD